MPKKHQKPHRARDLLALHVITSYVASSSLANHDLVSKHNPASTRHLSSCVRQLGWVWLCKPISCSSVVLELFTRRATFFIKPQIS